jgi:predicted NBD/HSP70 family sugar kinase
VEGSPTKGIGETNKNLVLNEVRRRRRASVDELVRDTGKSQPTVLKWLNALEREGYLKRSGYGESTGGRPPILYEFDAARSHFLGVAVEIPYVKVALLDLAGSPTAESGWSISTDLPPPRLLAELGERTTRFLNEAGAAQTNLTAVGVSFSGFIDQKDGLSLATPRLRDWRNVPVRQSLEEQLGLPVVLSHHIDALTLAELSYGIARSRRDFLYFDVGYGLGVRVVHRGSPLPVGVFGNAGLIGHTTVVPDGRPCLCGNRGCLEEYVSGRVLLRRQSASTDHAANSGDEIFALARSVFTAAQHGDETAAETVEEMIDYLAIGIANSINVFDLPIVVLSGFATLGGEAFRLALLERTRSRLLPTLAAATEIEFASVPRPLAGPYGAALFALRRQLPSADPLVILDSQEGREPATAQSKLAMNLG